MRVSQLELKVAVRTRGGRRRGAGRKPTRAGTWIGHQARPWHDRHQPVHITWRVVDGARGLRRFRVARRIGETLRRLAQQRRHAARRRVFRVVHFSIHLGKGLKAVGARLAIAINRARGRRGRALRDRYHAVALSSPRQVRHAVRFVLANATQHHQADLEHGQRTAVRDGIDPCSSAPWLDGWARAHEPPARPSPCLRPRTWLLAMGWRRHGLLAR